MVSRQKKKSHSEWGEEKKDNKEASLFSPMQYMKRKKKEEKKRTCKVIEIQSQHSQTFYADDWNPDEYQPLWALIFDARQIVRSTAQYGLHLVVPEHEGLVY